MTPFYSCTAFALMAGLYVFEGYQLALFARDRDGTALVWCAIAYGCASALMVILLRSGSYGVLMVVSSLAILIGELLISMLVFNEHYSPIQITGVGFGLLAIGLVSLPQFQS
tara:strand:- start:12761 stop:13096 length:336 start_codon:yes stop_codon:yes gene_type:complete